MCRLAIFNVLLILPILTSAQSGCSDGGKSYAHFDEFTHANGCTKLQCQNGTVVTTYEACGKEVDKKCHRVNEQFTFRRQTYVCTKKSTGDYEIDLAPPTSFTCTAEGREYKDLQTFKLSDGCNDYQCQDGDVSVTNPEACGKELDGQCHLVDSWTLVNGKVYKCEKKVVDEKTTYSYTEIEPTPDLSKTCRLSSTTYKNLEVFRNRLDRCDSRQCQNGDMPYLNRGWSRSDCQTACAISPSTPTQRISHTATTPSTPTQRTSHTATTPSTPTQRTSHTATTPPTPTQRTSHTATTPSTPTQRTSHTATTPSTPTQRTSHTATTPSTPTQRTSHTATTPPTPTQRTSHTATTPATATDHQMVENVTKYAKPPLCRFSQDNRKCYSVGQRWEFKGRVFECTDVSGDSKAARAPPKFRNCTVGSTTYHHLETFTSGNGCETSQCQSGEVKVIGSGCKDVSGQCYSPNYSWKVGTVTFKCVYNVDYGYTIARIFDDKPVPVCETPGKDVIFLLDDSGSIGSENFVKQKEFSAQLTRRFYIGTNKSKAEYLFGAVVFNEYAYKAFDLNTHLSNSPLYQAILNIVYTAGWTRTDRGLDYLVDKDLFGAAAGGRSDADNYVVLITDGQSNEPTATQTSAAHVRTLATILAVGVGSGVNNAELQGITGDPSNVYNIESYDVLDKVKDKLSEKICTAR